MFELYIISEKTLQLNYTSIQEQSNREIIRNGFSPIQIDVRM